MASQKKKPRITDGTNWHHWRPTFFHRCEITGKIIWPFKKAWYGVDIVWPDEDTRQVIRIWITEEGYTFGVLKGLIPERPTRRITMK